MKKRTFISKEGIEVTTSNKTLIKKMISFGWIEII